MSALKIDNLLRVANELVLDLKNDEDALEDILMDTLGSMESAKEGESEYRTNRKKFITYIGKLNASASSSFHQSPSIRDTLLIMKKAHREGQYVRDMKRELLCMQDEIYHQQNGMELIMSKYRKHLGALIGDRTKDDISSLREKISVHQESAKETSKYIDRVEELKTVLYYAIRMGEQAFIENQKLLDQFRKENETLRQLLGISGNISDYRTLYKSKTADKAIQTDKATNEKLASGDSNVVVGLPNVVRVKIELENSNDSTYTSCSDASFHSAIDTQSMIVHTEIN